VRVNFNYFISEAVFDFVVAAVDMVAREGWKLLDDYDFDLATGLWQHRSDVCAPPMSLLDLSYDGGVLAYDVDRVTSDEGELAGYLEAARELLQGRTPGDGVRSVVTGSADFEHLRWFPLPGEGTRVMPAGLTPG
jgi:hypothetical protein